MKKTMFFMIIMLLSGCAAKFSCKDTPNAAGCHSVSEMHNIINQRGSADREYPEGYPEIIHAGTPIRGQSKLVRIWIAPWVDEDDDYHDQEYLYVVINHGKWFIDAEKKRIQARYAPRIIPPAPNEQQTTGNQEAPSPQNPTSDVLK